MEAAQEKGIKTLILADINSMSGAVDFIKSCKDAEIKSIIGVSLSITDSTFAPLGYITLLAKNLKGWKQLLKLVSRANTAEFYKDHPRLPESELKSIEGRDLIVMVGGYNSTLAHLIIDHEGRFCSFDDEVKKFAKDNWSANAHSYIMGLRNQFGAENVYLEISRGNSAIERMLNLGVRYLSKQTGIPCIPSNPVHYLEQDDWFDHHLMLCVGLKIKKSQLREVKSVEDYPFICGPNFYLNISDEGYTKEELDNLQKLDEKCETYKIFSNPKLPKFGCPNQKTDPDYLRELCRNGWKKKIEGKIPKEKIQEYSDRVKEELDIVAQVDEIIKEPLLSRYFLMTQDYANYAKNNNIGCGPGRGSSGGSIIAYLTNITEIDPIAHNLFFSRFFNAGRINKDKFSLPDIDMDFEINKREEVIKYITNKYGKNHVGQVATFGREQGRGALRDVLRINEVCTIDEINKITSHIEDEAKLAAELEEMKESGETPSLIMLALRNNREKLSKWCYLDENENFQGEYARLFEQAVRLEGTLKVMGKHAAAVVISAEPLNEVCPVLHNKNHEELLAGFEYESLESLGVLKCDILGVAALDKISETKRLIEEIKCLKM